MTPGEDPEPYEHWKHTWHLHPGLEETGQVRTTAPVVESALLARPWEVRARSWPLARGSGHTHIQLASSGTRRYPRARARAVNRPAGG